MARRQLDYSLYNFDNVVAQLQAKLALQDTWKDTYRSGAGQMLIELFAFVADLLSYQIERRAEESYIGYAQLRNSVVALVALTGYDPRRKVSASGTVTFSLPSNYWDTHSNTVYFDKYTIISTTGGIAFVTTEDAQIVSPDLDVDVSVKQGELKYNEHTSDGSETQQFTIPASGDDVEEVENDSVIVYVDGTTWTEVSSFVGQTTAAQVYTLERKASTLQITFGDGDYGLIPPTNSTIRIEWVETDGASGNVYSASSITTLGSTIRDAGAVDVTSFVSVTNAQAAIGGEEEESLEEIRTNAPQVFATGDRAVTRADFKALLLQYPGVLKAEAFGEQELLSGAVSNPDYAWEVVLVVVPTGGGVPTTSMKTAIEAYLESKRVITTEIVWRDPVYIYIDFVVLAFVDPTYNSSTVDAAIRTALTSMMSLTSIELGDSLRYSDVVSAIEAVSGVDYHRTDVFVAQVLTNVDSALIELSGTLLLTPVDRGNLWVYVDNGITLNRIGYDDSNGNIVGPGISGSVASTINYETGVIDITLDSALAAGESVRIRYQTATLRERIIGYGDGTAVVFAAVLDHSIATSSVTIYRESVAVGTDDGSGNIIDAGGGEISSGTVDYTSGDISITFAISPAVANEVSVQYQYEQQDVEVSLEKLLQLGVAEVSVERSS